MSAHERRLEALSACRRVSSSSGDHGGCEPTESLATSMEGTQWYPGFARSANSAHICPN